MAEPAGSPLVGSALELASAGGCSGVGATSGSTCAGRIGINLWSNCSSPASSSADRWRLKACASLSPRALATYRAHWTTASLSNWGTTRAAMPQKERSSDWMSRKCPGRP
ncbi:MAG: hypothetical protein JXB05_02225, partial [Myxococcaceae bacterium]|nr:hypothetical protein [Myxococcaceae bacterium]